MMLASAYGTITAMLNPFPELLILGLLAPFILRLALGALFLRSAWQHATRERREQVASQLRVTWGATGAYFIWYLILAELVVGIMLLAGFLTQVAALIGIIVAVKLYLFRGRYPMIAPHYGSYYLLVIAVCISLLLSGAGAIAFDLPL